MTFYARSMNGLSRMLWNFQHSYFLCWTSTQKNEPQQLSAWIIPGLKMPFSGLNDTMTEQTGQHRPTLLYSQLGVIKDYSFCQPRFQKRIEEPGNEARDVFLINTGVAMNYCKCKFQVNLEILPVHCG